MIIIILLFKRPGFEPYAQVLLLLMVIIIIFIMFYHIISEPRGWTVCSGAAVVGDCGGVLRDHPHLLHNNLPRLEKVRKHIKEKNLVFGVQKLRSLSSISLFSVTKKGYSHDSLVLCQFVEKYPPHCFFSSPLSKAFNPLRRYIRWIIF